MCRGDERWERTLCMRIIGHEGCAKTSSLSTGYGPSSRDNTDQVGSKDFEGLQEEGNDDRHFDEKTGARRDEDTEREDLAL